MRVQANFNPSIRQNQQVKFSGVGCEAPQLLEKAALRNDALELTHSEILFPVVDRLGDALQTIKKYFADNKLVYANIEKEQKKGQQPRFWVIMMPEKAHLKRLNDNGYKKSDFIARSYSWLSEDSEVFHENVMKKAANMEKGIVDALQYPKLK